MKMTEKVFKGAKMWEVIFLAQVKKTPVFLEISINFQFN